VIFLLVNGGVGTEPTDYLEKYAGYEITTNVMSDCLPKCNAGKENALVKKLHL